MLLSAKNKFIAMHYTVTKISGTATHSAFTDLCFWRGHLYCCFREALNHISNDGHIAILKLDLKGNVLAKDTIREVSSDLRDPKLSVTPQNTLMLLAYQRTFGAMGKHLHSQPLVYQSTNGNSWSSRTTLGNKNWWLWRIRWHQQRHATSSKTQHQAFGFAYNRAANSVHLYSGDPVGSFHIHQPDVLSLEKHKLGYPNESDLFFSNNTAWAIVRRDADSCSAQLGYSNWPFKRWQWHDLGFYLGGPCMLPGDNGEVWLAGRIWQNQRFSTALLRLNLKDKQLRKITTLPSAGDNSYPGLVLHNKTLFMSYYSSHEDQKSQIYLAQFEVKDE
ncbi:hypothetical protein [Planctobacterium marinum]|uniref:hypothetical protein n=1 Tax=Planctobacterium marinum TaxID=1631968 RepID=UPI001E404EDD|nr:hypothetical protein [Planctobacterium marinum]MCC2606273.1 hypothetical protein [Planctobacterium marinum]